MRRSALCIAILATLIGPRVVRAARGDITLLGAMSLPNSVFVSDVWGYEANGREYAIIGDWFGNKVFVVDATDPAAMILVAEISNIPAFDVKVWGDYLYTCDGNRTGLDSRVIDLTDPANPVVSPNRFFSAHNISISATGMMTLESPGIRFFDVSADPLNPTLLFADFNPNGGRSDGHDSTPHGNRLYDFGGSDVPTIIWDVTDPANPDTLAIIDDPNIVFHHSGDATADGNTLLICDELAPHPTPDITVWDISDLGSPSQTATIADANATVHNVYIRGDLAFVSYYTAGFKVIDLSVPSAPVVLDEYDTSQLTGEGFLGAFGVYPFTTSGRVYVSDIDNGLFVFSVDTTTALTSSEQSSVVPQTVVLQQNFPNPFNPTTTIRFELGSAARVTLDVFDVRGRHIRTLADGRRPAGQHTVDWDGRDGGGVEVASGVYFYKLLSAGTLETRRMVLLK